jgi:hypothetical protein
MPASSRYGRQPSHGPYGDSEPSCRPLATRAASLSRAANRSATRKQKATRIQKDRKMSSRLVREWTMWCPSTASSSPATPPSSVEPRSRRATRTSRTTDRVPTTAADSRQKNVSSGSNCMPAAIIHLPSGGWTTKSGVAWKTSRVPDSNWSSA